MARWATREDESFFLAPELRPRRVALDNFGTLEEEENPVATLCGGETPRRRN
jgi:hypothetical protein